MRPDRVTRWGHTLSLEVVADPLVQFVIGSEMRCPELDRAQAFRLWRIYVQ